MRLESLTRQPPLASNTTPSGHGNSGKSRNGSGKEAGIIKGRKKREEAQMKKHGLKVEPVAYTGLFLACAHSPWPTTDGLQRATHLRSYLLEKNFQFNQIICHAMIKGEIPAKGNKILKKAHVSADSLKESKELAKIKE
ncbi:Pentatricopeptide repeat-containing protein 1, mitochondrial [Portunus trituberculatus]|uniref:Pentatricopeptide repeat-containing protein 1, mitochondrial n=1 Tax=Portunus trituberculatus TaxID=210409 RepID=A0A5B7FNY0_PORTR|nr:Pentatricopeptide repeat-containing protein 1, mitochondrial [Portunus trituberculatus]